MHLSLDNDGEGKQALMAIMTPKTRELAEGLDVLSKELLHNPRARTLGRHPLFHRVPPRLPPSAGSNATAAATATPQNQKKRYEEPPSAANAEATNNGTCAEHPSSLPMAISPLLHLVGNTDVLACMMEFLGTRSALGGLGAVTRSCRKPVMAYLYSLQVWHVRNIEPCFAQHFPLLRHLKLVNLDWARDPTYLHRGLLPISTRLESLSLSDTRLANHNDGLAACLLTMPWPRLQHLDVPADADFLERAQGIIQPDMFPALVSLDAGGWRKGKNDALLDELLDKQCFPALNRIEQRHRGQRVPVEFWCRDLGSTGKVLNLLRRLRGIESLRLTITGSSANAEAAGAWTSLLFDGQGFPALRHLTVFTTHLLWLPIFRALGDKRAHAPRLEELVVDCDTSAIFRHQHELVVAPGSLASLRSLTIKADVPASSLRAILGGGSGKAGPSEQQKRTSGGGHGGEGVGGVRTCARLEHLALVGTNTSFTTLGLFTLLAEGRQEGGQEADGMEAAAAVEFSPAWLPKLKTLAVHCDYEDMNDREGVRLRDGLARLPALEQLNIRLRFMDLFFIRFMELREMGALPRLRILRTPARPPITHLSRVAHLLILRWLKTEREGLARDSKFLDFPMEGLQPPALWRAICDVFPAHDTIEM